MTIITICDKCGYEFITELESYNDLRYVKVVCDDCGHHNSVLNEDEVCIDTQSMVEAYRARR